MPRIMFGAVRDRTTSKPQSSNQSKDAKNKPIIFPKFKTVHLRQETINDRGLSCPVENSLVVGIKMPANHPFMVSHNPNLKLSTKPWDRFNVVKAALGQQGFNINAPALPFDIINLSPAQINEDDELSVLKKHSGLYETADAVHTALRDIDDSAEPVVAQKTFSELSPLLEKLNEIDAGKSTNWDHLLVKPGDNTHHSGVIKFEHNTLLMKLVFPNQVVATFARAALLCWTSAVEKVQDANNELKSLTSKYREMAKSRKENKKDAAGWNTHTNKKLKTIRKAESELWEKIENLVKDDASINIHSDKVTESVTTNLVWVDHYQERFISVEIRKFDQSSFDVMNLRECSTFQGILQSADIGDEKMHKITYPRFLDPREAKVFIILPEPHINVLLCAIINESPNENPICEVRAAVISPDNGTMISVNLMQGYKSARDSLHPAASQNAVVDHDVVDDDGDLLLDNSQLEKVPQLKPVIVTYASIINHASIQASNMPAAAKRNKQSIPQPNNVASNNAPKSSASDIATLEKKITDMMTMISSLQEENKQLRSQLNNQRSEPKQSLNNVQPNTNNIESITVAIKAAMHQQALSINKRFDDLSAQLQLDAEENNKKLKSMVKVMVRNAVKSYVEQQECSTSRKRQCLQESQNNSRHNHNQSMNEAYNTSCDESDLDSLAQ